MDPAAAALLVPTAGSRGKRGATQPAIRMMLGLDPVPAAAAADWPSQTAIADALGLTRGRLGQIGPAARDHWAALAPLHSVRDEIVELVTAGGGVMSVRELEPLIIETRGSGLPAGEAAIAARAVVRAAIGLAHSLGMVVTAEGVESPEIRRSLEMLGCDVAQGFLFSPALAPEDLERFLARTNEGRFEVPVRT